MTHDKNRNTVAISLDKIGDDKRESLIATLQAIEQGNEFIYGVTSDKGFMFCAVCDDKTLESMISMLNMLQWNRRIYRHSDLPYFDMEQP